MKDKYKIELTKSQLQTLKVVLENYSRILIGQLGIGLEDILLKAGERHFPERSAKENREIAEDLIAQMHLKFWNQKYGTYYGVNYSELSDELIDMVEVIRHQLFLDSDRERHFSVDEYPPTHWNEKQPLIKVEKL